MKKYIIYRFTNTINHKCYIGFTTQAIERRTYQHYYVAKRYNKCHFHKALNKYSKSDWIIEVLEESYADSKEIKSRERYFVRQNDSYENGYNSTEGGDDFLSSEYQRELQKMRVKNGTHPFLGGAIQSETMKRRHLNGEFANQNKNRIDNGTHNFLGDNNPTKRLSKLGLQHNQLKHPWENSKTVSSADSMFAWSIADQIYEWYDSRKHNPRKSGYTLAARHFNLKCNLLFMINKFKSGWNPIEDDDWLKRFKI